MHTVVFAFAKHATGSERRSKSRNESWEAEIFFSQYSGSGEGSGDDNDVAGGQTQTR